MCSRSVRRTRLHGERLVTLCFNFKRRVGCGFPGGMTTKYFRIFNTLQMRIGSLDTRATAPALYEGIKSFCNPSHNGGAQDLALLCSLRGASAPRIWRGHQAGVGSPAWILSSQPPPLWVGGCPRVGGLCLRPDFASIAYTPV